MYSQSSNQLPGVSIQPPSSGGSSYRRGAVPQHLYNQGYVPTPNSHTRRTSVVDIAADFLGPAGPESLARIRQTSSKVEDWIDTYSRPIRPWLPAFGRFLIIVTFLEDALRILTQISGQSAPRRVLSSRHPRAPSRHPRAPALTRPLVRATRSKLLPPGTSAHVVFVGSCSGHVS